MYFSGEDDESAQDSMNLYGNFKSRRLTGGVVRVEPWDDGVPGFYGAVNPSRVPEPSVLAVLIAGCLALAMGHRIYNR
jgi:hypothetical protein